MFSTVFIEISLIFVQLDLENIGKTVRDPPFYYLRESKDHSWVIVALGWIVIQILKNDILIVEKLSWNQKSTI